MLVKVVLFVVVVGFILLLFRPRFDCFAELSGEGLVRSKGLSKFVCQQLDDFAKKNLEPQQKIVVRRMKQNQGRGKWIISKNASAEIAQRLRNLIVNEV